MFPTSNFLSDGPRYERDGAAVEAGLNAFLQVGRQFLLVSRHLLLVAILARARIGLLLLGHRCFSPYSCLLGCPRMPGNPTPQTLRIPLQACLRAGVRRERLGRDGNPETPVTRGARSRIPGLRAPVPHVRELPRANLSGRRSPTTRYCSRQVGAVPQAEHQTLALDDAHQRRRPARTRLLPPGESGRPRIRAWCSRGSSIAIVWRWTGRTLASTRKAVVSGRRPTPPTT